MVLAAASPVFKWVTYPFRRFIERKM
jgi:hypothetical protein